MGYIWQKTMGYSGQNYGIYDGIFRLKNIGYILKTMGYIGPLDIFSKH